MNQIERGQFAVFARNHRIHLDEAVGLCSADANRRITFRASSTWAAAERAVANGPPVPIYIAVVGSPGAMEYVAELVEVQTRPHRGDPRTERLLKLYTNSTKDEGLWEKYGKRRVRTLYAISGCRKLRRPFSMSRLVKASDGTPMSSDFRYSYVLVVPVRDLA